MRKSAAFSLAFLGFSKGFVPTAKPIATPQHLQVRPSTTSLNIVLDPDLLLEAKTARIAFALCFFGAVGSAATGREIFPKVSNQWKRYLELKGQGDSLGGEEIDFFGYPEPIYTNDIIKVLNNEMGPLEMVKEYPKEGTYPNALHFDSMAKANEGVSQMAVRAVFDSMVLGINKNQINPLKAEFKIKRYQADLDLLKEDHKKGRTVGVTALVTLFAVLGLADYFSVYHLLHGWFPGWQGFAEFPTSLFDERGLSTLSDYFTYDLPE